MEIYKKIPALSLGLDNYEVSNYGKVRNIKSGRILKATLSKEGYEYVELYKNNLCKKYKVHRLVCITFLGDQPKLTVNHKNFIRNDNRLSNLEWMTLSDNVKYSTHNMRRGKRDNTNRKSYKKFKIAIKTLYENNLFTSVDDFYNQLMLL